MTIGITLPRRYRFKKQCAVKTTR